MQFRRKWITQLAQDMNTVYILFLHTSRSALLVPTIYAAPVSYSHRKEGFIDTASMTMAESF